MIECLSIHLPFTPVSARVLTFAFMHTLHGHVQDNVPKCVSTFTTTLTHTQRQWGGKNILHYMLDVYI